MKTLKYKVFEHKVVTSKEQQAIQRNIEGTCDYYGKDGWELCATKIEDPYNADYVTLIFKREVL